VVTEESLQRLLIQPLTNFDLMRISGVYRRMVPCLGAVFARQIDVKEDMGVIWHPAYTAWSEKRTTGAWETQGLMNLSILGFLTSKAAALPATVLAGPCAL